MIITVENQYQLFLERMGLVESEMHPVQKKQLRETFYGATGQMLITLRDDISTLPEEEGIKALDNLLKEVQTFLLNNQIKMN